MVGIYTIDGTVNRSGTATGFRLTVGRDGSPSTIEEATAVMVNLLKDPDVVPGIPQPLVLSEFQMDAPPPPPTI